uniref:Uncharacterized protein n=1 Tax=Oryza sativa subsp. japonica TaxID=39947 RepID=Q6ESI9_ORYSJ|nr:hypothetical protein [Oryza sativa Japonica Group]
MPNTSGREGGDFAGDLEDVCRVGARVRTSEEMGVEAEKTGSAPPPARSRNSQGE